MATTTFHIVNHIISTVLLKSYQIVNKKKEHTNDLRPSSLCQQTQASLVKEIKMEPLIKFAHKRPLTKTYIGQE